MLRPSRYPLSLSIWSLVLTPAVILGVSASRSALSQPARDPKQESAEALKLMGQLCSGCHGASNPRGGVNLARFTDVLSIQKDQTTWRKALEQLRDRSMPPRGAAQPTEEQRERLVAWLGHTLDSADESVLPKDPGRVLIHRLNRTEYNNTVRDLFGVSIRPADSFPADGGGGAGFDNNSATLFIPPILMERYLGAATEVIEAAPAARIFTVRPGKGVPPREAARRILGQFAVRGFRRPVAPPEVERLLALYDTASKRGQNWESSVRYALKAILVSPHFLFRVEKDRGVPGAYPVSDWELASRLSYFLWSSMPDPELFRLASQKKLRNRQVLDAQVRRMLLDPKAAALADNFVSQWLHIRELKTTVKPDPRRYPTYTPSLRDAMYRETIEFFATILKEDASLLQLLDADYAVVNEELARHYGLEGVTGPEFRKVPLKDRTRGGLLTMASVLTVTSYPQRTSPVLRGKWVLEDVLGASVPPPPPNAGGLPADDAPKQGLSFRQRLELHRQKPECASCHSRMDPIGFGLENFDAIGRWRNDLGGQPLDAAGVLSTGEKFTGPVELKRLILERKDDFLRNLTQKMLAYSLGRGLEPYDLPTVRRVMAAVKADGYKSSTLIREIVKSYPFQYRKDG